MKDKKNLKFIFEYEKKVLAILFIIFTMGFCFGCYNLFNRPDVYLESFSHNLNIVFLKNIVLITISFLLGYTVIGFPFLCFSVIYCGIFTGISLGYFTYFYGYTGCLFYSVIFYLYYLIFIFSYFFIVFSSFRLSASLYSVFKEGTRYISPKTYSRPHIIRFVFYISILLFISIFYRFLIIPLVF